MNHTCLCLPSRSWYSFTDPEHSQCRCMMVLCACVSERMSVTVCECMFVSRTVCHCVSYCIFMYVSVSQPWPTCIFVHRPSRLELTSWKCAEVNIYSHLQVLSKDIVIRVDYASVQWRWSFVWWAIQVSVVSHSECNCVCLWQCVPWWGVDQVTWTHRGRTHQGTTHIVLSLSLCLSVEVMWTDTGRTEQGTTVVLLSSCGDVTVWPNWLLT